MPIYEFLLAQQLLASILVGYLLGSVPFAHLAARAKGIDIFATGNRRAGTANIFWNVSRRIGILVFAADTAKGVLAVIIAALLGVQGPLLVLAGGASVLGHWKSVFTGFRGGDGMATLMGITLTLVPLLALAGIAVGFLAVVLSWAYRSRSSWGIAACFTTLLSLSLYTRTQVDLALSLTVLAGLVVFHNVLIRRRLAGELPPDDLEVDLQLGTDDAPETDVSSQTSHNHH
jgi:acyl phosphate:glycerol-3-phosphate acyltransferase